MLFNKVSQALLNLSRDWSHFLSERLTKCFYSCALEFSVSFSSSACILFSFIYFIHSNIRVTPDLIQRTAQDNNVSKVTVVVKSFIVSELEGTFCAFPFFLLYNVTVSDVHFKHGLSADSNSLTE